LKNIHKKEQEGQLYESGTGKKIAGHSKLKLWTYSTFFGGCEWPLVSHKSSYTCTCSYRLLKWS